MAREILLRETFMEPFLRTSFSYNPCPSVTNHTFPFIQIIIKEIKVSFCQQTSLQSVYLNLIYKPRRSIFELLISGFLKISLIRNKIIIFELLIKY